MATAKEVAAILAVILGLAFVCAWANPPWAF